MRIRTWATVLLPLLLGQACNPGTQQPKSPPAGLIHVAGGGMRIALVPLRPLYTSADSLDVAYIILNRGDTRTFVDDPRRIAIDVIGPDGAVVPLKAPGEDAEVNLGTHTSKVLPGGIVGHVLNLACARYDWGETQQAQSICMWSYMLSRPGTYRLVARYEPEPPVPRGGAGTRVQTEELVSDTLAITFDPR